MTRWSLRAISMLGLFALLLASLYLLNSALEDATRFGRLYIILLLLNSLFLLVLVISIGVNLAKLIRQQSRNVPGSRLTTRLVIVFVVLAVAPAAIVYVFSLQMLQRGIDSWFDVHVERALQDALDLSRSSLDLQMHQLRQQAERLAGSLVDVPNTMAPFALSDMLGRAGAVEIVLFGDNNRIIASSGDITASMVPRLPNDRILRLVSRGETYVGLDPLKDSGLRIRVVAPIPVTRENLENRMLQVLFPVSERIDALASSVHSAFGRYKELVYLRTPLKQSFVVTLSLVLLLAVLFAVWVAFLMSRKLIAPIRELAEGTKAVAAGEYHKRLPVGRRDDLGLLVLSFNQMTERLAEARDTAERSQRLVERQRAYLETVLEHLSSGVISLDPDMILRTVNAAASHVLGVDLERYKGRALRELGQEHHGLAGFYDRLAPHLKGAEPEWREQLNLFTPNGRRVLMCQGARLPTHGETLGGQVIVFDDITVLIQAQREAAWAEVARRLAHEIKNPLTPIQLSAERLQKKLLPKLAPAETEVLNRSTRTIVQQVESMKGMVNAFGDYARTPLKTLLPLDLNALIKDVVELYRSDPTGTRVKLDLDRSLPRINADSDRIRQLLHNLIKNALEAVGGVSVPTLSITTRVIADDGMRFVELVVADNGPGIPSELMDRVFEPYVTNKTRGNGLGLAIVKKIVEDHGGRVWAQNLRAGGACIHIRLLSSSVQARHNVTHIKGDAA
jgi:nitrogen fixation/metabolism regulation signal transduction histidine kinase